MAKLIRLAILTALLSSCATTAKLEARMQARIGQNINDVISEIGPPTRTFVKPDGNTVYTWANRGPATATPYNFFGTQQVQISNSWCDVSYTAGATGIIESYNYNGNQCRSR